MTRTRTPPHILILSGPSGVGKTTIWEALHTKYIDHLEKIVTTTTRIKREGEIEGKHYYFLSRAEFQSRIDSGDMIEYALVHGNYYGSTFEELERIIELGKYPLYIVDPQGMVHLKPLLEHRGYTVQTFFLLPPSIEELRIRLSGRGTEQSDHMELRLANALVEMEEQDFYDHKVINTTLEETMESLASIIFSK
ncbi:TPA: guanylate kinase [Candidatus Gracilibacteria bacterium]|nr:guanylate kinase [Candidatus Gracilibacteria bacterium]